MTFSFRVLQKIGVYTFFFLHLIATLSYGILKICLHTWFYSKEEKIFFSLVFLLFSQGYGSYTTVYFIVSVSFISYFIFKFLFFFQSFGVKELLLSFLIRLVSFFPTFFSALNFIFIFILFSFSSPNDNSYVFICKNPQCNWKHQSK